MSETGESRPWGSFLWKLSWITVLACAPAYFAWVANNSIKPYFEEHGLGSDAAHTGLVLASCIMHVIVPYVRETMKFLLLPSPPGKAYLRFSGSLAIVALVFDCLTAKFAWEWHQLFNHAGETVLAQNCLALFIIVIIGLALEAIALGLAVLLFFSLIGAAVISEL
ncbi:hypothetical protein PG991_011352 [Apiospora marii]|uniref:Uncharacterized protein n=1 Tax=Apiospora marii TaxID=335849 RepID=A0ABR1RDX0_9PEZI